MRSPFPGMDPWLEDPSLWPDFHNRLIAAIADFLSPILRPRYYVALEERIHSFDSNELEVIGRPDVTIIHRGTHPEDGGRSPRSIRDAAVLEVQVPRSDELTETYLEVRQASTRKIVTIVEILSPANKLHRRGREIYERKRKRIFDRLTNLVEVDLLRAGERMPLSGRPVQSDYRILVSRGTDRPKAQLYAFGIRQPIPSVPLPLLPGEEEPRVELDAILHDLYERAAFDLRLDYSRPPVPPLGDEDAVWARGLVEGREVPPTA